MQVFDIMSQVQDQLAAATNLDRFLKILVGIVKELTGFHRVMVYQFDTTFNGKVVTELVDPTHTRDRKYPPAELSTYQCHFRCWSGAYHRYE